MSDNQVPFLPQKFIKPNKLVGVRHHQFLIQFVTLLIFFGMRTCLSVSIISMTEKTPPHSSIPTYPEWDKTDIILSSFFWGYIVPQVFAGQMSEYFGPKWFLFTTMVIGSVFNLAIPAMAAFLGSTGVIACRVIQGLCQGFLYPSLSNLISRWAPLYERSQTANFVYGGATLGIAISMPLTGLICGSELGWPVSYYVYGGAGLIWALVFAIFAQNSPADYENISNEEKNYIESTNSITQTKKKIPTPWRSIVTSLPVWALLIAGNGQCWGCFTLLTEIPSYMNGILNFNISSNSQLSALPYLAQFLIGLFTSPLSDRLIASGTTRITTSRRIFQCLGSFMPAAALIYLAFLKDFDAKLVIVLLVVAVGTSALQQSGYLVNLIDVAPNHSGTLFGIVNGTNNIFSLLGLLTVGFLGDDKSDPILWRKVFLLAAAIYVASGIFYAIFSSAKVQLWNDLEQEKNKKKYKFDKNQVPI